MVSSSSADSESGVDGADAALFDSAAPPDGAGFDCWAPAGRACAPPPDLPPDDGAAAAAFSFAALISSSDMPVSSGPADFSALSSSSSVSCMSLSRRTASL
ncbi:hypothetical protein NORO109296_13255 [Nocardiopsis rhodophaea]